MNPLITTGIHVLLTGGPTVLLFDSGSRRQFVFGTDNTYDRPTLRRYAEVWQRVTPFMGALGRHGYAHGLKIRYADDEGQPASTETPISTVTKTIAAYADANKFFGLAVHRGTGTQYSQYSIFGTYRGESWQLNLHTGERIPVADLRVEDGLIHYSTLTGLRRVKTVDSVFDYGTGERIAHHPQFASVMAQR
jgi:hypothetical protein